MNHKDLDEKILAILMFQEREGQEDDIHVLTGVVKLKDGVLHLHSGSERPPFQIQEEWLERIKYAPEALSETLSNAEYYLSLSVGPLPEDADMTEYTNTGLNLNNPDQ
jgi:hypothetical protein